MQSYHNFIEKSIAMQPSSRKKFSDFLFICDYKLDNSNSK